MLLMDGLLNFSKTFLPDQRGGRMDAPLVMSSRIDPSEIDDEARTTSTSRGSTLASSTTRRWRWPIRSRSRT